nr:hypothetical protein [Actinomycetes bacterium]
PFRPRLRWPKEAASRPTDTSNICSICDTLAECDRRVSQTKPAPTRESTGLLGQVCVLPPAGLFPLVGSVHLAGKPLGSAAGYHSAALAGRRQQAMHATQRLREPNPQHTKLPSASEGAALPAQNPSLSHTAPPDLPDNRTRTGHDQ